MRCLRARTAPISLSARRRRAHSVPVASAQWNSDRCTADAVFAFAMTAACTFSSNRGTAAKTAGWISLINPPT